MSDWNKQLEHESGDCPEKERFLDTDDFLSGHGYWPTISECIKNYTTGECEGTCNRTFLDDTILYLFELIAKENGFAPKEKTIKETKSGKVITTKETIVGVYTDENNHSGFIHWKSNRNLLPEDFQNTINSLEKIDSLYVGENYTLVKQLNKSFAFSTSLFQNIKQTISLINYEIQFYIREYLATPDGKLFALLMNDKSLFIIAGRLGFQEYIEEERIILTEKVNKAHPFFNFEPYKKVDWTKLKTPKGKYFESLCEIILSKQQDLIELQPIGKTNAADRGRDFILIKRSRVLGGNTISQKWLVQCKYSEDSINHKTIPDWTNRVLEHHVDGYWLITNNDISPALYDQLNSVSNNKRLKIETMVWQRNQFDALFNTYPELFTSDNFD